MFQVKSGRIGKKEAMLLDADRCGYRVTHPATTLNRVDMVVVGGSIPLAPTIISYLTPGMSPVHAASGKGRH